MSVRAVFPLVVVSGWGRFSSFSDSRHHRSPVGTNVWQVFSKYTENMGHPHGGQDLHYRRACRCAFRTPGLLITLVEGCANARGLQLCRTDWCHRRLLGLPAAGAGPSDSTVNLYWWTLPSRHRGAFPCALAGTARCSPQLPLLASALPDTVADQLEAPWKAGVLSFRSPGWLSF